MGSNLRSVSGRAMNQLSGVCGGGDSISSEI